MSTALGANLPAELLDAIAILGVPARVAIIRHLASAGAQTRGQLAESLGMQPGTVQKNLEVLRAAGVIVAGPLDYSDGAHHRIEYRLVRSVAQEMQQRLVSGLGL